MKIFLFTSCLIFCFLIGIPHSSRAADDIVAIAKVKATFRKVIPRKININDINLFIPEIEVTVPTTGIYNVQFDGGELKIDENEKEGIAQTIILTIWLYIDVLEREPGIAAVAYENLISTWDKKKGELIEYSVEMPPYNAAYHVKSTGADGGAPFDISIICPAGDNFMIKISLSTARDDLNKDKTIELARNLLDFIIRKAIDVEVESIDEPEKEKSNAD